MKFMRISLAAIAACGLASASPLTKRSVSFNWASEKVRGVSIGGWLVLEPWITPSLFEGLDDSIVDEYTLGQKLGKDAALKILQNHWDTWVRWEDFKKIKDSGFNVVRLPVGYWAYDTLDSPYVSGAAPYVDAAIDWARSVGLKVIVDLHGAPGSQNGFDNSGQLVSTPNWQSGDTVAQTLQILKTITDKYAQTQYQDVIAGIELLNEPLAASLNVDTLYQYYRDGFGQTRDVSDTTVMLHDGFRAPSSWNGFLTPSDNNAQNVVVDHHEYQVFDNSLIAMQPWQHRQQVCTAADGYSGSDKWSIVGEWTGAMTDCAKWLNGRGTGARYDGTFKDSSKVGDCGWQSNVNNWSQEYKDETREYIEAQMSAFETRTQGWVWWNFKTESAHEWDAFALIDAGVFPQPLTQKKFDVIC
ncbi:glycoside hydrolase [Massarina eburnea CBS 473.64]|uniref:glucan 1,3-beta-glucosidase n=1 Tax=Massarina eburnea CBS 473.64 TaxID=1395130 RepID=A0A6A6RPT2_9PLEO|nr:glycoside hydrolase [Massarina eburnea CBS 473.64]